MQLNSAHPYSPAYAAGRHGCLVGALNVDSWGVPVSIRRQALDAALNRVSERLTTIDMRLSEILNWAFHVTKVSLPDEANPRDRESLALWLARSFSKVSRLPDDASAGIEAIAVRRSAP